MSSPTFARNFSLALADLRDGVGSVHIWPMLGWSEIRSRYRRSVLGPFWLTLSTGMMIGLMGLLYAKLFGQSIAEYLPYLAASYIVWLFLASILIESCNSFISAEAFIRQMKLPFTVHVMRLVWRNLIIFAHHLVIVLVVVFWYRPGSISAILLAPVGLFVVVLNAIWLGIFLGMTCARFRDVAPIVQSIAQIAFFLTPVLWKADMLGGHAWSVNVNPFFHLLELIRAPLLGQYATPATWLAATLITSAGYLLMLTLFSRFRARIAYWV